MNTVVNNEKSRSRVRYFDKLFNCNRTPSRSRFTDFHKQRRTSRSRYYSASRKNRYRSFSRSSSKNRQFFRNFNSLNRLASKPSSRSASAFKRFVIEIQLNSSEDHDHYTVTLQKSKEKFEVNLYTTQMMIGITSTGWFYELFFHFQNEIVSNLYSRLEIAFLMNNGESILVLNKPTFTMVTQMLLIYSTYYIKNVDHCKPR